MRATIFDIIIAMTGNLVAKTKAHFIKIFSQDKDPLYLYLPTHVAEVEKWAKKILKDYPKADAEVALAAVWLHDIGHIEPGKKRSEKEKSYYQEDHAVKSEAEARRFLKQLGVSPTKIDLIAHCVRAHRCKDIQPKSLEAKVLAAADSASHFTDINYIIHIQDGFRDYASGKIERDYRDVNLLPGLKNQLTPLYRAWKKLLAAFPE